MSVKLSMPQAELLSSAFKAGEKGVLKPTGFTPAVSLVTMGFARWARKYNNGREGQLVITDKGVRFKEGRL